MDTHKSILLNVSIGLLESLNLASNLMSISRSELIRRSLIRDLDFVLQHEVTHVSRAKEEAKLEYARWAKKRV